MSPPTYCPVCMGRKLLCPHCSQKELSLKQSSYCSMEKLKVFSPVMQCPCEENVISFTDGSSCGDQFPEICIFSPNHQT